MSTAGQAMEAARDLGGRERTYRVHLCLGPNCSARGSRSLLPVLEAAVARAGLADRVEVLATTCRNRCDYGPSMNVYPGPVFYNLLDERALEEVVARHLAGNEVVEECVFRPKPQRAKQGVGSRDW